MRAGWCPFRKDDVILRAMGMLAAMLMMPIMLVNLRHQAGSDGGFRHIMLVMLGRITMYMPMRQAVGVVMMLMSVTLRMGIDTSQDRLVVMVYRHVHWRQDTGRDPE